MSPGSDLAFTPRLPPLRHQAEFLRDHGLDPAYALFWEQGTGKTKALIDNAVQLFLADLIDGMVVLAPNGIHFNWIKEELPKHWPGGGNVPGYRAFAWDVNKASNKSYPALYRAFLEGEGDYAWRFPVLCMSYDGLMTDPGKKAHWDFLRRGRRLYVGDESQRFKTPGSKRTKRVVASSVYAPFRRIASGTPIDQPPDIYSQVKFLDEHFWARQGLGLFSAFKAQFVRVKEIWIAGGKKQEVPDSYKNLDELADLIRPVGSRVLKSEVLDLPRKTFKRIFHPLTREQRAAYDQLREEAYTILRGGEVVTSDMALVLQLRLAQISCGFLTPCAGAEPVPFRENPRADYFLEFLRDTTSPTILWGQFVQDVKTIVDMSRKAGRNPVVFDGSRPDDAIEAFMTGRADDIVANLNSNMREGYTLNRAKVTAYYSNSPKVINRLQSEDRNHRIGQDEPVLYADFLGEGTLDNRNLKRLRGKRGDMGTILGDDPAEVLQWLLEPDDEGFEYDA